MIFLNSKNKINCFVPLYFFLFVNLGIYAQVDNEEILQFENGLTPLTQIKDSAIIRYNIEDRMKFFRVPAVSIAVVKNGKIILSKGYGEADINSHRKADSTTLFQVASISKTVNALCILKLVEENKIALTTDFRQYIRDGSFKENEYSKNETITIANLLSHTGGINRDDGPSGDYTLNKKLPTITEIVKGEKPALGDGAYCIRKPNEAYQYSNQGVCITQKILTDLFDPNYNSLITEKVFTPLKMQNSSFSIIRTNAEQEKLACGYLGNYKIVAPWVFPCQAQGGLVSTASDIAKLIIAIQDSYNEKQNAFLKKEIIQNMLSPQLDSISYIGNLDVPYRNGLGIMLFEKRGKSYFTHSGIIDGYTSIFIGSYDGKDGAVILLNSSNARIIYEILNAIATTFKWENYVQYNYKKAIKLNDTTMKKYIGIYRRIDQNRELIRVISIKDNQVYIEEKNNSGSEILYFLSENDAFILSKQISIRFIKNKNNMGIERFTEENSDKKAEEWVKVKNE